MNNPSMINQPQKIWDTKMIVVVCSIAILSLAIIVFSLLLVFSPAGGANNQSSDAPILAITTCPDQVTSDSPSFTVEGYIVSDSGPCTLTINGEQITNTSAAGNQVKWSKVYNLNSGQTKELVFEVRDNNNVITKETKQIYCQPLNVVEEQPTKNLAPITPGCTLVKKKAGGLNIREYPGTQYDIVDSIASYDYTSEMVFTGNYRVTSDNYTWYEVISPRGKHGYVRSDLVRTNRYTD